MAYTMPQTAFPQQMVGQTFQPQAQPLQQLQQPLQQLPQQQQQQQQPFQMNHGGMAFKYQTHAQPQPFPQSASSESMNLMLAQRQQKIQRDHASLFQQLAQQNSQLAPQPNQLTQQPLQLAQQPLQLAQQPLQLTQQPPLHLTQQPLQLALQPQQQQQPLQLAHATPVSAPVHAGPVYHNYQQQPAMGPGQAPIFVSMGLGMQMPATYMHSAPTTTAPMYMPPMLTNPVSQVGQSSFNNNNNILMSSNKTISVNYSNNNGIVNIVKTKVTKKSRSSSSSSKRKATKTNNTDTTQNKEKIKRDDCGRFAPNANKKGTRKAVVKPHSTKPVSQNPQSKYRCVRWYKRTSRWVVQVRINGERKHVGYFDQEEDAAEAYRNALAKWKKKDEDVEIPASPASVTTSTSAESSTTTEKGEEVEQ